MYDKFMDAIQNKCNDISDKLRFYKRVAGKLTDEEKELFYDSLNADERILFMSIFEGKVRGQDEEQLNMQQPGRVIPAWRKNYLILCGMDEERRDVCLAQIWSKPEDANAEEKRACFLAENLAAALIDLIQNYQDFNWEKSYCSVINSVWKALDYHVKFVEVIEHRLEKYKFLVYDTKLKVYFDSLLEKMAFAAASDFFDRIYATDGSFAGMFDEEIKSTYLAVSSPRIVWKMRKLLAIRQEGYSVKDLYEDVCEYNKDERLQKWVEMNYHISNLKKLIVEEAAAEDSAGYMDYIQNNRIEMFDTNLTDYMTQLLSDYVDIFNYVIENDWNIGQFLELVEPFNLFSYQYISFTGRYHQYDTIRSMSLISKLKEKLFAINDPEKLLKVYMNTHLKFCIEFNDVIKMVYSLVQAQCDDPKAAFENIFAKYVIAGKVVSVAKNTLNNALKLCPENIYSEYNSKKYREIERNKEERLAFFGGCIKSQHYWVCGHKKVLESFEQGNSCEFVIVEVTADGIYAKDIVHREDETKEKYDSLREDFADKIIMWLKDIQKYKEMLPWSDDEEYLNMRIENIPDYGKRREVAVEILRTLGELKSVQEIGSFIRLIGQNPYKKFNEFRHIRYQRFAKFRIKGKEYHQEIIKLGWKLLSLEEIPSEDKVFIFKGTCLKAHFLLEEAEKLMQDVLTVDAVMENEEIKDKYEKVKYLCPVVPVVFAGREDRKPYFSTWNGYQHLVFNSKYRFLCDDISEEQPDKIVLLRIKNVNHQDKVFHCIPVDENEKNFDIVRRAIYDMKRECTYGMSNDVKKQLEVCKGVRYGLAEVRNLGYEIQDAFRKYENDIEKCRLLLDTLESVNPFLMPDYRSCEKRNVTFYRQADMYDTYNRLLEKYHEEKHGFRVMCRLYFETYLKWLIPLDKFLQDVDNGRFADEINSYLKEKYL